MPTGHTAFEPSGFTEMKSPAMVVAGGMLTGFGGAGIVAGIAISESIKEGGYVGIPVIIASAVPIGVGVPLLVVGALQTASGRRTADAAGKPLPMGHRDEGMVIAGATLTAVGGAGLVTGAILLPVATATEDDDGWDVLAGVVTLSTGASLAIIGIPILAVGAGKMPVEVVVTGPTQIGVRGSF